MVRWGQRLSMFITLGCCMYVVYFLFTKDKGNKLPENSSVVSIDRSAGLASSATIIDLKPYASVDTQARDIFSLNSAAPSGAVENTPKGQLPDHLKIVGILVSHPSQIVIEDTLANKTFFINEGESQDGIRIGRVSKDQMLINYQGQNITVPITKR